MRSRFSLAAAVVGISLYADAVTQRVLENYGADLTRRCLVRLLVQPWSSAACGDEIHATSTSAALPTNTPPAALLATLRALPPIPRKIHVSWRSSEVPPATIFTRVTILALIERNPGWLVTIYNDSQLDEYLRAALPAYSPTAYAMISRRPPTEKVDLWRLVVMHREGGVYTDYDRWALTPLSKAIPPGARLLLPTYRDANPSQDLLASAPGNPLFLRAIQLNIARRRLGWRDIYALGPATYQDAVAEVLLGVKPGRSSTNHQKYIARALRAAIARVPDGLIVTSRESPPCLTATSHVTGLVCAVLWPLWRRSKKAEYARIGVRHWSEGAVPHPDEARAAQWKWADLTHGRIVENPKLACAQTWPTTRLFWLVALARAADRAVLPLACGDAGAFRKEAYLPLPRGGAVLFVRSKHLRQWVGGVLPAIDNSTPFVLATADPESDHTLPQDVLPAALVRRVLSHPSLRGWWATNANHPRVHRLPLGIDYHNMAKHGRLQPDIRVQHLLRPRSLYSPQEMPDVQETNLLAIAHALPAAHARPAHLAWADFHFEQRNRRRKAIYQRISGAPWLVVPPRRVRRSELWQQKGQYLFDLSPQGHGIDCFRTWESLALGMIVIVERGPLGVGVRGDGGLFADLPVVQVRNFTTDINATALRHWAAVHRKRHRPTNALRNRSLPVPDRLKLSYWLRTLRRAARGTTAASRSSPQAKPVRGRAG